jgi:hypothetical protein
MRYLIFASILLTAGASLADTPSRIIRYDYETKIFSKWRKGKGVDLKQDTSDHYDASDVVAFTIVNAPCGVRFRIERTEFAVAELGADVRGLDSVEGLIHGTLAPPPTAGIEALPEVVISELTLSQVLTLLRVWEGASALKLKLRNEWQLLQEAFAASQRGENAYRAAVCAQTDLSGQGIACPPFTGTRGVDKLDDELDDLLKRAKEPKKCPSFSDLVADTNSHLNKIKSLRTQIAGPPIGSKAPELVADLRALQLRTTRYRENLELVLEGVKIARELLADEVTRGVTLAYFDRIQELKQRYGDTIHEADVQELAITYRRFRATERTKIQAELTEIQNWILSLDPNLGSGSLPAAVPSIPSLRSDIDALILAVATDKNAFVGKITSFNNKLEDYFKALDGVYEKTKRDPIDVTPVGSFSSNIVLIVKVFAQETYRKPDLETLNEIELPAGAIVGEGDAPEPSENEYELEGTDRFQFHKTYRYNIGGGFMFSALEDKQFGIGLVPRLDDNGNPVVDETGDPVSDGTLIETASDSQLNLALTFGYYILPMDVFPGARRWNVGLMLGVAFSEPTKNFYYGFMLQPTIGVQFLIGLHRGFITEPEPPYEIGSILPPGTTQPPVIERPDTDLFVGINLDINLFRKVFGSNP